jgi:Tol biopolymer transport system component
MRRTSTVSGIGGLAVAVMLACDAGRTEFPVAPVLGIPPVARAFTGSTWSTPVRLDGPVNSPTANDQGPTLSPDGLSLYFCSNRPPSAGNDLWVSRRASKDAPWPEPMHLGSVVNSPAGDCGPSLSQDGRALFFTSGRAGGAGLNDIYMSRRSDATDDLSWGPPVRLDAEVNTALTELSPFITRWRGEDDCTEDGGYNEDDDCSTRWAELYFERGSSNATTDIYLVRIDENGLSVGPAAPVHEVNSGDADGRPTVRFDGREMILHSNRDGRGGNFDLFVSTRRSPNHRWSTPRPIDELNSSIHEIHPYLSKNGRTVFFVRGQGVANDIWMATRTRSGR